MRWVQISPHQDVMKLAATKHQPRVNHTLIYDLLNKYDLFKGNKCLTEMG